jgi:hypothetical protein
VLLDLVLVEAAELLERSRSQKCQKLGSIRGRLCETVSAEICG